VLIPSEAAAVLAPAYPGHDYKATLDQWIGLPGELLMELPESFKDFGAVDGVIYAHI